MIFLVCIYVYLCVCACVHLTERKMQRENVCGFVQEREREMERENERQQERARERERERVCVCVCVPPDCLSPSPTWLRRGSPRISESAPRSPRDSSERLKERHGPAGYTPIQRTHTHTHTHSHSACTHTHTHTLKCCGQFTHS